MPFQQEANLMLWTFRYYTLCPLVSDYSHFPTVKSPSKMTIGPLGETEGFLQLCCRNFSSDSNTSSMRVFDIKIGSGLGTE